VLLIDDVLSGLDPITEEHIFTQLFGENGLLRGGNHTTVFATHAGMCFYTSHLDSH